MEINSQPQIIVSTPTSTNSKDSQQIYISTTVYEKKNQIKYTSNMHHKSLSSTTIHPV